MGLLNKIKARFPSIKDVSGERLHEHLKNMGIDAEIIPEGSWDEPRPLLRWWSGGSLIYTFSVRLKGLNIDAIQINEYELRDC